LGGLHVPLLLEPGLYRAAFLLRRGHYPRRGVLLDSYGSTGLRFGSGKKGARGSAGTSDRRFSSANEYEPRWIEFTMNGRAGHAIEPRVYWLGLANGEAASIDIERFPDISVEKLAEKAERMGEVMEKIFWKMVL